MNAQREVARWLRDWATASAQIERLPGEHCLTSAEIAAFLEGGRDTDARRRIAEHLGDCSFCSRQVAALYHAERAFEERRRVREALGSVTDRLSACLRVFVDAQRIAFTRLDALVQGIVPSTHFATVLAPAGVARGRDMGESGVTADTEPDRLHEVVLEAEAIAGAEVLCSGEAEGGSVTVILPAPCEVRLLGPDGAVHTLPVDAGEEQYYATMTALPPGEYLLTILRPGD